jgi:hypothetical protein
VFSGRIAALRLLGGVLGFAGKALGTWLFYKMMKGKGKRKK